MSKLPAEIYIAEGKNYMYHGKFNLAIESFQKAVNVQPHHVNGMNDLGLAYLRNNQFDHAIQTFQKTLDLNPQLANVYKNLGTAHRFKGDFDKAIECYTKALQINPDLSEVYDEIGLLHIAKDKNYEKAIQSFEKAVQLDHMNINALNNITKSYLALGDKQKAKLYNQKALNVSDTCHLTQQLRVQVNPQQKQ